MTVSFAEVGNRMLHDDTQFDYSVTSTVRLSSREMKMREAVIVSTARTPIGRAYRGAFNDTQAQALAGHVVAEVVRRAEIDPAEVEDVVLGAALQQGSSGFNLARQAAVRGGLPVSV